MKSAQRAGRQGLGGSAASAPVWDALPRKAEVQAGAGEEGEVVDAGHAALQRSQALPRQPALPLLKVALHDRLRGVGDQR